MFCSVAVLTTQIRLDDFIAKTSVLQLLIEGGKVSLYLGSITFVQ